ncbi:hypothetical protein FNF31_00587 [Cafeteria roenbergensis]|uniref:Palmitoyl-protein thioesterase 1 n=1 Tax=Cafeteria roenbergensis TaxID=33653 RepID=A0A5A8DGT6_CAFRO|nr:hypothetical protein FNF28_04236 [Cafeteria roenbergensis]KAA0168088.1 hypothetical protein FNF31_00587 [Cafeteria roenbergensis]
MRTALVALGALCAVLHAEATSPALGLRERVLSRLMVADFSKLPTVVQPRAQTERVPLLQARRSNFTPVVLMHGLGDAGSNPGMEQLARTVSDAYPGKVSLAVNVSNGFLSYITPMQAQVDEFAATVRADPRLAGGFDAVGLSQGGIIVRAYVEQYNDPPVRNLIGVSGVMNGVFNCPLMMQIIPFVCEIYETDPYALDFILGFSEYFVLSQNKSLYLSGNPFLPALNGQTTVNETYKRNFESLNSVTLGMALNDTVVYPKESEQFGGYAWGTKDTVFTMRQADFYESNSFGLRTLNEAGKVSMVQYEGDHLRFSDAWWNANILPRLAG